MFSTAPSFDRRIAFLRQAFDQLFVLTRRNLDGCLGFSRRALDFPTGRCEVRPRTPLLPIGAD